MNDEELWLHTILKKNGVTITALQLRQLQDYKRLLLDWNQRINLISRKNEENVWKAHIFMSLTVLFKIDFGFCTRILDLGTGGGLPGIPLSILLPEIEFVLLDSIQKKVTAVSAMISELKLPNVITICGRAEKLQESEKMKKSFNAVIARAVSSIKDIINFGYPFLVRDFNSLNHHNLAKSDSSKDKIFLKKPSLVIFKGGNLSAEIATAERFFPKLFIHSIPLTFQGSEEFTNAEKHLIIVQ